MPTATEPVYVTLEDHARLHDTMVHYHDKMLELIDVMLGTTARMTAAEGRRRERELLLLRILARLVERAAPEMTYALHDLKLRAEQEGPPPTAKATSPK